MAHFQRHWNDVGLASALAARSSSALGALGEADAVVRGTGAAAGATAVSVVAAAPAPALAAPPALHGIEAADAATRAVRDAVQGEWLLRAEASS